MCVTGGNRTAAPKCHAGHTSLLSCASICYVYIGRLANLLSTILWDSCSIVSNAMSPQGRDVHSDKSKRSYYLSAIDRARTAALDKRPGKFKKKKNPERESCTRWVQDPAAYALDAIDVDCLSNHMKTAQSLEFLDLYKWTNLWIYLQVDITYTTYIAECSPEQDVGIYPTCQLVFFDNNKRCCYILSTAVPWCQSASNYDASWP